jgi:anaerobic dimethyl sulfoxide reductase subunit B (iron-sulfur subunit)
MEMQMSDQAILVDYEWCSGCRACEVACQMEHQLPLGRYGVKVVEVGPWEIDKDVWQHSYIPLFTDECNLCSRRTARGKLPSCVQHCQAAILTYGAVEKLAVKLIEKPRQLLVNPRSSNQVKLP